jgi:hypothetical protein
MFGEMLRDGWLDREFTTASDQRGTRRFLQAAKERWEQLRHRPLPAATTLAHLYEERRLQLLADPKRLLFDADALQWLVKQCAQGLPDLKIHSTGSGYFTVGWETPQARVLFGFESGSNWKRWDAIARHAGDRAGGSEHLKAVLFRAAEQSPIPGPHWKVAGAINAARLEYLHLIVLSRDELAELYAGYDLYFEALGGDIPPHAPEDVLNFLRETFAPWWRRFSGPIDGSTPPASADPEDEEQFAVKVREVVLKQKFLSMDEVIAQLGADVTADDVLKACRFHTAIRVHAHPNMTVLQWQNL